MTPPWVELSVEADLEAVEAVSEILGRVAPGGTSVEPGFELVEEWLGARIDPARPATVRAYVQASDPAAVERAVAEVTAALNFLAQVDSARTRLGVVTFGESSAGPGGVGGSRRTCRRPITW